MSNDTGDKNSGNGQLANSLSTSTKPACANGGSPIVSGPHHPVVNSLSIYANEQCVKVPAQMVYSFDIFSSVFDLNVWNSLTPDTQANLMRFLPSSECRGDIIQHLLNVDSNVFFGNHPLRRFYDHIRDGKYFADGAKLQAYCKQIQHERTEYRRKQYYMKVGRQLLIRRKKILENASRIGCGQSAKALSSGGLNGIKCSNEAQLRQRSLKCRAWKRAKKTIAQSSEEAGFSNENSSDDEADLNAWEQIPQQSDSEAVTKMLSSYKHLRSRLPEHPSLKISEVKMEDIIKSCGMESFASRCGVLPEDPSVTMDSKA